MNTADLKKEEIDNVLTLSKPIMINGNEVHELTYDFENMTAKDKINAGKRMKNDGIASNVEELDTDYHLYLFAEAVCKANPEIDTSDVFRMNAKDARKAARLARSFFYLNSED